MLDQVVRSYNEAVIDTDRDRALAVVRDAVRSGVSPEEIVFGVVVPNMEVMMRPAADQAEFSLAQYFMTSQIAAAVTDEMLAAFKAPPVPIGRVVIGTALGDLHSLGKKIVIGCLKARTIEVEDLGVNVPPERFVDEALARDAQVIAVSAMMVHTARGERGALGVREILRRRGLESRLRLVVGGAPYRYDPHLYETVGADAWADNGVAAGRVIADLVKEVRP